LIIDDKMAIGCAVDGKLSKWYFMSSCRFSFCVSICENLVSSGLVGRWP
jgi:hypothetical protein